MKSATSTLHEQLAAQPGFHMSDPKEPNFFSDEDVFAKGLDWYRGLFAEAGSGDIRGESSTHYTKLPTHPKAAERLHAFAPDAKLIYVMRHPIDRLVSHYIHEWSQAVIPRKMPIDDAIDAFPEMVEYGKYAKQLEPYLQRYGKDRILPMFFERILTASQDELERVCRFLGYPGTPKWAELDASNVSNQRMRRNWLLDRVVESPTLQLLRRSLLPASIRSRARQVFVMRQRPELSDARRQALSEVFDRDLADLSGLLGTQLTCANFKETVRRQPLDWAA